MNKFQFEEFIKRKPETLINNKYFFTWVDKDNINIKCNSCSKKITNTFCIMNKKTDVDIENDFKCYECATMLRYFTPLHFMD